MAESEQFFSRNLQKYLLMVIYQGQCLLTEREQRSSNRSSTYTYQSRNPHVVHSRRLLICECRATRRASPELDTVSVPGMPWRLRRNCREIQKRAAPAGRVSSDTFATNAWQALSAVIQCSSTVPPRINLSRPTICRIGLGTQMCEDRWGMC